MSYKLQIRKQIHGCFASLSTEDIWLVKDFELPFAPFLGLTIVSGENEFKIESDIIWYAERAAFVAYAEEDKEIYQAQLKHQPHRSVNEVAKEWEEMGWEKEGAPR